jgi:hypothetical protein
VGVRFSRHAMCSFRVPNSERSILIPFHAPGAIIPCEAGTRRTTQEGSQDDGAGRFGRLSRMCRAKIVTAVGREVCVMVNDAARDGSIPAG